MRVLQGIKGWAVWASVLGLVYGPGAIPARASILKDPEYVDTAKDCPFITGTYQVEGLYCAQPWLKEHRMAFFQLNATGYYGNWLIFSPTDIQFVMSGPKLNIAARAFITQYRKSCVSRARWEGSRRSAVSSSSRASWSMPRPSNKGSSIGSAGTHPRARPSSRSRGSHE